MSWRWKSRKPGRPALPKDLRELEFRTAGESPTWGEERIANDLSRKLGILHTNVTDHPTAEWTIQQFREFMAFDHPYRFAIHDRDAISSACDPELKGFGVRVTKTPIRAPTANAYCERLVGTLGSGIPEPPKPSFRLAPTGTSFPMVIELHQRRFSADYTTNIGWRRRPHDGRLNYCGAQYPTLREAHIFSNGTEFPTEIILSSDRQDRRRSPARPRLQDRVARTVTQKGPSAH